MDDITITIAVTRPGVQTQATYRDFDSAVAAIADAKAAYDAAQAPAPAPEAIADTTVAPTAEVAAVDAVQAQNDLAASEEVAAQG